MRNQKGFTLIEVIASVFIFSMIIIGITSLVSGILTNSNQQSSLLANNDSAQQAAFKITQELRNSATSATGAYALADAEDQQLIIFTNSNGTVNRVRYYLQSGSLYKGTTAPSGNPVTYNVAQEVSVLIQKNIANGATPLFYYYDGNYNGTGSALTQPVNVTNVKLIKINLMIYKKLTVASTGTYTVTASGSIRNLKTNLGN